MRHRVPGNGSPRKDHEPGQREHELAMEGGVANRGKVVRIGQTVHRPQRPTSAATHALLRHLEDVHFDGAPRFLGIDDQDREILSYIEGTVAIGRIPAAELTDTALVSVARLLRDYHAAVASFISQPYTWSKSPPPRY